MTVAIIQIIVGVILVVLIILQERSAGLSGLMGGDSIGFYQTRRGLEKIVFVSTIGFTVIFVGLAVYQLVYA